MYSTFITATFDSPINAKRLGSSMHLYAALAMHDLPSLESAVERAEATSLAIAGLTTTDITIYREGATAKACTVESCYRAFPCETPNGLALKKLCDLCSECGTVVTVGCICGNCGN